MKFFAIFCLLFLNFFCIATPPGGGLFKFLLNFFNFSFHFSFDFSLFFLIFSSFNQIKSPAPLTKPTTHVSRQSETSVSALVMKISMTLQITANLAVDATMVRNFLFFLLKLIKNSQIRILSRLHKQRLHSKSVH